MQHRKGAGIMEYKGIKLYIVLIVMLTVISLFFVGKSLYRIYNIEKPIKEELLALNGVGYVDIVKKEGRVDIYLTLLPDQDFFAIYQEIEKTVKNKIGNNSGDIIILNNDKTLEDVYHRIHFAIYEGIYTNKYLEMERNVKEIAANEGIKDYKLWVDNDAVYIQLNKNNKSFYKRIPNNKMYISTRIGGDYTG
ncbi:MAG: hypothetical protein GX175_03620 [Halanaerobiaceae bacterium]|nr:hypothetical protein [Halanaerobiaceae bacterium]